MLKVWTFHNLNMTTKPFQDFSPLISFCPLGQQHNSPIFPINQSINFFWGLALDDGGEGGCLFLFLIFIFRFFWKTIVVLPKKIRVLRIMEYFTISMLGFSKTPWKFCDSMNLDWNGTWKMWLKSKINMVNVSWIESKTDSNTVKNREFNQVGNNEFNQVGNIYQKKTACHSNDRSHVRYLIQEMCGLCMSMKYM